jgi:hypothetical protein
MFNNNTIVKSTKDDPDKLDDDEELKDGDVSDDNTKEKEMSSPNSK